MKILNPNEKDRRKKGFLPFFSRIFGEASKTAGGLGSGALKGGGMLGKAGFFTALFSTKAGVVGLLLGAATIAAGIGLIYNYIAPSSGKIYTPALFSDAYYQEAQRQANIERASQGMPSVGESSLSKFAEAAQKEFSSELPKEESSPSSQEPQTSPDSHIPEPAAISQTPSSEGRLQSKLGFDAPQAKSVGGGTSFPRLQTSGGVWSNLGKQFSPIGTTPARLQGSAKAGEMNKALTARLVASPKYQVPNINKKGAFGQAKFAGKVGVGAAYSPTDAGARVTAEQAFSGETAGSGDIATPIGGTGLGGAGISQGTKLKANDPSLNMSEYTPPTPEKKTDTPWKKLTDYALYAMLASVGFIAIAKMLANKAKALMATPLTAPQAASFFAAAKVFAVLAMGAAAMVIAIALQLATKHGQKMLGLMYGVIGGTLIVQAVRALWDMNADGEKAMKAGEFYEKVFKNMNEAQKGAFQAKLPQQQWNIVTGFNYEAYGQQPEAYLNTLLGLNPKQ